MKDKEKTQKRPTKELTHLRLRIAELEALGRKRNQFEEALRTARDKAQQYLDIAEVILIALNKKGEITLINRKGNQILGYKEGELVGKNWFTTCVPSRLRKKTKSGFLKLMAGERKLTEFYENQILTKSGTERMIAWHNTLLKDTQGNPIGTLSSGEDITKRREAEEALKESESRFRSIIENSKDGIIFFDGKTRKILFGNGAMAELLRCSKADLVGRSISSLHPSEEWASVEQEFQKHVSGEISVSAGIPVLRSDGSFFYADISSNLIMLEGRSYFSAFFRDITERRRIEEALRASEEKYRLSFINVSDVIYTLDTNLMVTSVSPSVERALGYKVEEVMNRPFHELNILASEFLEKAYSDVMRVFSGEQIPASIYEFIAKDGTRKIGEISGSPLYRNGKIIGLISVARDITERKRTEAQIARALRETSLRFEISQALAGVQTEDEVLDVLIQHAGFYPQVFVVIYTFDKTEGEVAAIVRRQNPFESGLTPMLPIGSRLPVSNYTLLGRISPHQPFVSDDILADEKIETYGRDILAKTGAASIAVFPLMIDNEWMCLIMAMAKSIGCFDEEKQNLYHTLAEQGAVALRAARLREQIRESQQRFQSLVETLSDWIWEVNENGIYTYVSPKIRDLLGYEPEEVLGKALFDLMPPEEAERVKAVFESLLAAQQPIVALENSCCHKDGHLVMFETNGAPFFDAAGQLKGYRGVDRDITERKRAAAALQESEETARALVNATTESIFLIDTVGTILTLNEMTAKRLGKSVKEMLGSNLFDFLPPDVAQRRKIHLDELLRTKKPVYLEDERQGICFDTCGYPIFDATGKINKIAIYARDITERKQAEQKLKESEAQFRTLFEAIPDCIIVHDDEGVIVHINESGAQQLEYSAKDLIGRNLREIVAPENHVFIVDHIRETHKIGWSRFETNYVSRSGWKIAAEVNDRHIKFGEKKAILRVSRDITERKQAEKALRESEEKYRDLVENINDILYATDEHGIVTYVAPAIEAISGYSMSEIIGRPFFDFVHEEDIPNMKDGFQQDIFGRPEPHEFRMLNKAGVVRWVRASSRPFLMGNRVAGLRGIMTDITGRKQAEEAVKRGYEQLQETLHATVNALASTVEMKDQYTAGHQPRVTKLACAIAEEMGLPPEQIEGIRMAAAIHDIGKIMVPAEILNKPGRLTEIQYEMIKMHPRAGYDILKGLKLPWPVAQIILQHHERMDGSGYPQGLSGEKIMVEARILMVANVVEAMNAHRPYRPAYDIKEALAEISRNKGTFYDPAVVDACLQLFNEKGFTLDSVSR
jgi:PAS domain S-box-containing protein/putative nucleotidyltransferase with HDIG domain